MVNKFSGWVNKKIVLSSIRKIYKVLICAGVLIFSNNLWAAEIGEKYSSSAFSSWGVAGLSVEIVWKHWDLVGEPIYDANIKWKFMDNAMLPLPGGNQQIEAAKVPEEVLKTIVMYNAKLYVCGKSVVKPSLRGCYLIDLGIPDHHGGEWGYNVPGSKSWDKMLLEEQYNLGGEILDRYRSAEDAKRMLIGGFEAEKYSLVGEKFSYAGLHEWWGEQDAIAKAKKKKEEEEFEQYRGGGNDDSLQDHHYLEASTHAENLTDFQVPKDFKKFKKEENTIGNNQRKKTKPRSPDEKTRDVRLVIGGWSNVEDREYENWKERKINSLNLRKDDLPRPDPIVGVWALSRDAVVPEPISESAYHYKEYPLRYKVRLYITQDSKDGGRIYWTGYQVEYENNETECLEQGKKCAFFKNSYSWRRDSDGVAFSFNERAYRRTYGDGIRGSKYVPHQHFEVSQGGERLKITNHYLSKFNDSANYQEYYEALWHRSETKMPDRCGDRGNIYIGTRKEIYDEVILCSDYMEENPEEVNNLIEAIVENHNDFSERISKNRTTEKGYKHSPNYYADKISSDPYESPSPLSQRSLIR